MADWKQITARIRRARGSRDPGGQLALLYEKTGDAMVAFELGRHFEVTKDVAQALHWYLASASKFRRGDWKTKARDAVLRLGGELPPESTEDAANLAAESTASNVPVILPEPAAPFEQTAVAFESLTTAAEDSSDSTASSSADVSAEAKKGRRRRGRRGGRNRRKSSASSAPASHARGSSQAVPSTRHTEPPSQDILPPRVIDRRAIPRLPVEELPEASLAGIKSRFGDPGLASRLSLLEMQLRRLLTCPPAKLDQSALVPAGPGVFVLTDDEMTTYYYVEACDTLRVAISALARSGTSRRGNFNLKGELASHLGISEARVTKYLNDHCVVRWLQLDEGSVNFYHFVIAILRPVLHD